MSRESVQIQGRRRERGFVLITMGVAAVALFGALGMAVDLGRMFITKNETQSFCDAGALAAVMKLDGTTTGITNAKNAVTNLGNKWNMDSTTVASPDIKFATSSSGPWVADPNPAIGYTYTQVTATVSLPLYFIGVVVGNTTQSVTSLAKAGQVAYAVPANPNANPLFRHGLAPYTAVSTNTTGPNFGLTVGTAYDIQWPAYNGTRAGCGPGNPDKCFVSDPCAGDANKTTEAAVVSNWGASINGYWGSNSNSTIEQEVLDVIQLAAVDVGTNIFPDLSNGNKAAEAKYLDERASWDTDLTDNTVSSYLAATHNGRRLLPVPIVDPVDPTHTKVIGYGLFLLYANTDGSSGTSNYYTHGQGTNGNDPYCAMYAGSYFIGSTNPGATGSGGSTGAVRATLVQ